MPIGVEIAKGPSGPTGAPQAAAEKAQTEDAEKLKHRYIEYHKALYGSAAAYDNAVILAGFAGFFALWAGTADDIPRFARLLTVALMGISLMVYIASVVGQMLLRQHHLEWRWGELFGKFPGDASSFNAAWEAIGREYEERLGKLKPWLLGAFWTSLIFGFTAALTLAYNALGVDFGWPVLVG